MNSTAGERINLHTLSGDNLNEISNMFTKSSHKKNRSSINNSGSMKFKIMPNNPRASNGAKKDSDNFFMFIEKSRKCQTENSEKKLSCQKTLFNEAEE